jgi:protein SCO1/2
MFRITSIRQQIIFSSIAFAALALLFGMWSQHNIGTSQAVELKSGTLFPVAREIHPFNLLTAPAGQSFSNENLKGHWSMLFFGFTHCAMLCPTTLTSLNQSYQKLQAAKVAQLPQVVFISIDPERDSLKDINDYVKMFNKNFTGATGTKQQLDKLTKEFSILYMKITTDNSQKNNYQIDHSGTVLLINPQGQLQALFSPPIDAKALADDYQKVMKAYQQQKR